MALPVTLWDKAFQSLSPDLQKNLGATRMHRRQVLEAVLKEAEDKRMLSLRKRWKYTKPNGDTIIVRDLLEKIVRWIEKFKETGDIIVQYDPGHSALPWAAVRFLLRIAVSEVQIFAALVEDLEYIARMMVRYRAFETLYLGGSQSDIEKKLVDALTYFYAEILTHLSIAVKFFQEPTLMRLLKSPFRSVNEERAKAMKDREKEVDAFAKLVDAQILRSLEAGFTRLSTQTLSDVAKEKYDDILEWLSMAPYYHHHQFIAQSRLPNMGQWLLGHAEYKNWRASSSPCLLLIHGIAGSGKSTLCSTVIDTLSAGSSSLPSAAPFGYFYCTISESEKDRSSSDSVLRTILFQLALDTSHPTKMRDFLCAEYERQLLQARAGKMDMLKLTTKDCVRLILELAEEDPMTIIIDAIDAVNDTERPILIQALREIVSKADNVVNILVSSRSSSRVAALPSAEFRIQITSEETRGDMEAFVDRLVDNAVTSKVLLEGKVSVSTKQAMKHEILERAGEMFLFARLQVERICRESVEQDAISILQRTLPEGIDQLYRESLMRILDGGNLAREVATQTISWVLFMREPLTPRALLSGLASGKDQALDLSQVMATCFNLVVLDSKCNVVRFAHQSVQDFLRRHPAFAASKAHRLMATCCINACSRGPTTKFDGSLTIPNDDFYVYAAMYWPIHTEMSQGFHDDTAEAKDLARDVTSFIFDEDWDLTLSFESWVTNIKVLVPLLPRSHVMKPTLDAIPQKGSSFLFVLSMFGLDDILVLALSNIDHLDVNHQNELGHTPVYLAAAFGHSTTVDVLIRWGANVNVEGGRYGSPLHAACFRGHLKVVSQLLHLRAQVCCGSVFKNALQAAFRGGQEQVALHLIDLNQNIETEEDYEEALGQAALLGFVNVVQKLQISRSSSSKKGNVEKLREKTWKAIQGGHVGVLRQFLGRDATNTDHLAPDAVALATLHNQKSMVEFLLDQGMDLEAPGPFGSPLRTASLLNFHSIVRFLLDKGAQIDASGPLGDALQAAALNGHTSIARLLIQEGANINQHCGYYGSALQAAAYHGHIDTVELLINSNADVDAVGYSKSAMHAAAEGGHEDVIMLILRKKQPSVPTWPDDLPQVALKPYYSPGRPSHYKALLRDAIPGMTHSQDQEAQRFEAKTHRDPGTRRPVTDMEFVFRAAKNGSINSQFYMEQDSTSGFANSRWIDEAPLVVAASFGHEKTVNWLLRQQQEPLTASDNTIRYAISVASKKGHSSVVHTLLEFVASRQTTSHSEADPYKIWWDVDAAFHLASRSWTPEECAELSRKYSTRARKYYHADVGKADVLLDFALSCTTGDVQLAGSILETDCHGLISLRAVEDGIQLCGWYGQRIVAQLLLESPILRDRNPSSGREAFINAAANGFLDIMKLFACHWPELSSDREAVGRALVVASRGGHIATVRYLVLELAADINTPLPDLCFVPMVTCMDGRPFSDGCTKSMENLKASHTKPAILPVISPLQASLHGLALEFDKGYDFSPWQDRASLSSWSCANLRNARQDQQEQVIDFLLQNNARPNDAGGRKMLPIQVASKSLSANIVQLLTSAGADFNAVECSNLGESCSLEFYSSSSALFEAAGRETSGLPMVRLLITSGAALLPENVDEQNRLLGQALRYFEGDAFRTEFHIRHTYSKPPDGRFEKASSLKEVFTEGPGAVLHFLLSRMPQIKSTDRRWGLVLQMAAFLNEGSFVDLLLSRGTDMNSTGYYYGTALQAAARCGHATLAQRLLDAGAEVNLTGGVWYTALRAALVEGHEATVLCLLDHGADVKLEPILPREHGGPANQSETTLQLAAQTGNTNIVTAILAKSSDVVTEVLTGKHPLVTAASKGEVEMVRALLEAGAPVNVQSERLSQRSSAIDDDVSPIHAAIAAGHSDIVSILIDSGADIESTTFNNADTPLAVAASRGNILVVRDLISAGARIHDSAALNRAVQHNHLEVVKVLLDSGAMAKDALPLACRLGDLNIVECLVENALESDTPEIIFNTAYSADGLLDSVARLLFLYATPTKYQFLLACATAPVTKVQLLLDEDLFDINQRDEYSGDYALQIAALHLRPDVVRVLISHGANIDVKSSKHGTPLNSALKACATSQLMDMQDESMRHKVNELSLPPPKERPPLFRLFYRGTDPDLDCVRIVKDLIAHGADIEEADPILGPPLHLVCLLGFKDLVELILSKDQNRESTVGHFETPLFAAIQGRHSQVTSLLLQHGSPINHAHTEYGTALHHACTVYDGSSAKLLLDHGSDATLRDNRGRTALTVALQQELNIETTTITAFQWARSTASYMLPRVANMSKSQRRSIRSSRMLQRKHRMGGPTPLEAILDSATPVHVSHDDITKAVDLKRCCSDERYVLQQLLCMESNRLSPHQRPAIDSLEIALQHDPSTRVSPKMFLHVFQTGNSTAERLLNMLERYGKSVYTTAGVEAAVDDAYNLESQASIKRRFHDLLTEDENEWDSADSDEEVHDNLTGVGSYSRCSRGGSWLRTVMQ